MGGITRLGHKIEGAQSQRFESRRGPRSGMRAHDNHRDFVGARDLPQSFHAIHARHVEIECDHMRPQLLDLLQPERAIHGRAHYFDGFIALQNLRNQLAHERGIIYHQNSHLFAHAVAPFLMTAADAARALPSLDTTAEMFRIKTTVPSPRMEAPLTRSVATK